MPPTATKKDQALVEKVNLKIEKTDPRKVKPEDAHIPEYKEKIDLTEGQVDRLRKEIFKGFDNLSSRRKEDGRETKWDGLDAQFDGEMEDTTNEFSLNVPTTKVKIRTLVRNAGKAFLRNDPKFIAQARPDSIRKGMEGAATKQQEYLDYLYDEDIPIKAPLRKVFTSAAKLGTGILKVPYEYRTCKKKQEEVFDGNDRLKKFVARFPEAEDQDNENHVYYKALKEGKDQTLITEYEEVVYNNPKPEYVALRDFWVDPDVEGYDGLCKTRLTIERERYDWWELKRMEEDGDFENVEDMKNKRADGAVGKGGSGTEIKDFENMKHDVFSCVYWFDVKATDDEGEETEKIENQIRIICWFGRESKAFLGAILYPYYTVDAFYIPFYVIDEEPGFYKNGMAEDLTDTNIAENALLNFTLEGAYIQNTVTPIVREGSDVANQFLEKRWSHGVPIILPSQTNDFGSEVDFVDKVAFNSGEMINILLYLAKNQDDVTISSLASGKETPSDPQAPAAKTALLMKQSTDNIEEFIDVMEPGFNKLGEITLQLIYQMSRSGRKFRQKRRADSVVGGDPFETISPDEMIAKTIIQSQAIAFAFDKVREKQENLALYQVLRAEPQITRRPETLYELTRTLIKSWSPMWNSKVDLIWPTPEEFNQDQVAIATEAMKQYMAQLQQIEQLGGKPEVNINDFLTLANQLAEAASTPQQESK